MTATPPRADLRTLAAEALRHGDHALADDGECGRREDQLAVVDDLLAAVLPEHRRMVLGEAAEELTSEIEWQREKYGDGSSKVAIGRLIGMEDAHATLRRLAAAAPPAGLSATVPAENAPAVPEPPVRPASDGDALTYAEMESERDRLAGELYEAQMMIERLTVDDDAKDGTRRAWLELEHWRTVIVPELMEQRDRLGTDRDRLAYQVAGYQRVVEAAKAWRDADSFRLAAQRAIDIRAAVDALSDAGTDQTEGET